ncbi:MAG: SigE family RNA polymerase sigma factor [Acidimicrobiales bacterium]
MVEAIDPSNGLVGSSRPSVSQDVTAVHLKNFESNAAAWTTELAGLAYLLTGDTDEAEDLVADALLATWKHWPRVAATQNPRAYVRRTVMNLAASRVRTKVRDRTRLHLLRPLVSEAAPNPDLSGSMDLHHALRLLPRRQRECVTLRYGMDLPVAEVAEVLSISIGSVKSNTAKGANRLRVILESGVSV